MTLAEGLTLALSALGLVGGLVGFFSGRSGSRKADAAQATANDARERSAKAAENAVEALRRANEIAEEAKPKPTVVWSDPIQDRQHHHLVMNQGNARARGALLVSVERGGLHPDDYQPIDVDPGTSLGFAALRTFGGGRPTARITWIDPPDGSRQEVICRI